MEDALCGIEVVVVQANPLENHEYGLTGKTEAYALVTRTLFRI